MKLRTGTQINVETHTLPTAPSFAHTEFRRPRPVMGATSEMDSAREEWLCYQEQTRVLESGDKEKRQKLANIFDKICCELKTPQSVSWLKIFVTFVFRFDCPRNAGHKRTIKDINITISQFAWSELGGN